MGLASSLSFLSAHVTLLNTGKSSRISPLRFLCVGFRWSENVAICFVRLFDANSASGMCISPVTYAVLCVRFVWPLFAFVAVKKKPLTTLRRRRNTRYWWLVRPYKTCPLVYPDKDFHLVRNDKLRLPHIKVEQPVAQLPPHRSQRAELPHWALLNCSLCTSTTLFFS